MLAYCNVVKIGDCWSFRSKLVMHISNATYHLQAKALFDVFFLV